MIEQGNFTKTTLKCQTSLKYIMRSRRSTPTRNKFVKELKEDMDCKNSRTAHSTVSNCRVPAFENWFRRSRTTQIDMLFNETCNKDNHSIPSIKNQNKWFVKLETSNCANYSMRNSKCNTKYVHHTGTVASSSACAGALLAKRNKENQKFIKCTMDLLSFPDYHTKKGRPHGHRHGKKSGDKEYHIAHQLKKKWQKRSISRVSTTELYEMTNSTRIW